MDFFLQQDVSLLKEQPTENLSVEYHILTAKKKTDQWSSGLCCRSHFHTNMVPRLYCIHCNCYE